MITEFTVMAGERIKRLDAFLVSHERGISRSRLQRLIVSGRIRVNEQVVKPSQKIQPGDRITMDAPEPGPLMVNDEVVPLVVLYEDEALLVVNKPSGVVVHPTSGNWKGTLLNGLLAHLQASEKTHSPHAAKHFPGLVHRLDKDTSGVMVVAKTDQAHRSLCSQFEQQTVTRSYEALIYGKPGDEQGVIDLAIGRDVRDGKKVSSHTAQPQTAVTVFKVLHKFGDMASHVELTPRTGRQHQLRVHMASLGCPIMGDRIYGAQKACHISETSISRMMLHARRLGFQHPVFATYQEYTSEPQADFVMVFQALQEMTSRHIA